MVTVTDPDLLWGGARGRELLGAQTATAQRMSAQNMDRYGMADPDLRRRISERLEAKKGTAGEDLDVRLQQMQLRKDLHSQRLKLMWETFRRQQKEAADVQRRRFYGSLAGAAGTLGASAWPLVFGGGTTTPTTMSGGSSEWMQDYA